VIGKKGRETLQRHGYNIREDYSDAIEEPLYSDAMEVSQKVLDDFASGEIGEIYLAYTGFKNTVVHVPTLLKLLPVEVESKNGENAPEDRAPMNFEPEDDAALDMIIPKYVTSLIFGGMVESVASENGARMQAMDSATSNAEEMIDHLTLQYNRARQGSITQELTEIIAGANAISM
jgi:F-type H+-transporting ATPase subunit gamma